MIRSKRNKMKRKRISKPSWRTLLGLKLDRVISV
jgi:hypothetical protein